MPEQVYKVYKQLAKKNIIPILITSRLRQNKHTINHALTFNAHVLTGIVPVSFIVPHRKPTVKHENTFIRYTRLRQGYGGHYFAYASRLVWPATRSVAEAKCGWGVRAKRELRWHMYFK